MYTCVKADLAIGGIELLPPLEFIFGLPFLEGLPFQVIVLTDGSVSNREACIQKVKRNVESARYTIEEQRMVSLFTNSAMPF